MCHAAQGHANSTQRTAANSWDCLLSAVLCRAHRIGQTNCVNVQLLLVKDSIDEVMWELLQSKLATTGQVLDGQKDRMEVRKAANTLNMLTHTASNHWPMIWAWQSTFVSSGSHSCPLTRSIYCLLQVDKSAQHRAKTGWTMTQQDNTQADKQPSIKDFFGASGAASKKQRLM